ncbi:MAG: hypothetical protein ACTHML_00570 [Ginsengibacter sp.]
MFSNTALDVFIGLVFIFLLYSLLATIMQEIIATRFAFRAKVLEKAILRMLEDGKTSTKMQYGDRLQGVLHLFGLWNLLKKKTIAPWFYAHPLIKYLAEDNYYSKPAYLKPENFSKVMIDLLKGFGFPESQMLQVIHQSIMEGTIYKLPINLIKENETSPEPDKANPAIKVLREQNEDIHSNELLQFEKVKINRNTSLFLKSLWQESGADLDTFEIKLEKWFDDTMARATGWYKRYTRIILFFIGFVVAVIFNVDVIAIHRVLSKDKNAREQLVKLAIESQDKLAPEVERQRRGESASDSILQSTYNAVAEDATQANTVLGLGRVWIDTCKICKDSLTSAFNTKAEGLKSEVAAIYTRMDTVQNNLKQHQSELDSIKIRFGDKADSLAIKISAFKALLLIDSSELIRLKQSPQIKEYQRMNQLQERCAFIKSARKGKYFVYAPNQSGDWETFIGWLFTAFAVTLGAPFWFDLLSKLIKIRGSGTKIDDSDISDSATLNAPSQTTIPVSVNVNTSPGEEAVG